VGGRRQAKDSFEGKDWMANWGCLNEEDWGWGVNESLPTLGKAREGVLSAKRSFSGGKKGREQATNDLEGWKQKRGTGGRCSKRDVGW